MQINDSDKSDCIFAYRSWMLHKVESDLRSNSTNIITHTHPTPPKKKTHKKTPPHTKTYKKPPRFHIKVLTLKILKININVRKATNTVTHFKNISMKSSYSIGV